MKQTSCLYNQPVSLRVRHQCKRSLSLYTSSVANWATSKKLWLPMSNINNDCAFYVSVCLNFRYWIGNTIFEIAYIKLASVISAYVIYWSCTLVVVASYVHHFVIATVVCKPKYVVNLRKQNRGEHKKTAVKIFEILSASYVESKHVRSLHKRISSSILTSQ